MRLGKTLLLAGLIAGGAASAADETDSYEIAFATYLGGAKDGQVRDVFVDAGGNTYVTGGSRSKNFPRTVGPRHAGSYDVFATKYDPRGKLVWSRLVGGPAYDRAYAIEVDAAGFVYLGGRAGPGFPVTAGALQTAFGGDTNPGRAYGKQDGFIVKLTPDGKQIVWATYFGGADRGIFRDIDIDAEGNVYGALTAGFVANPHVTAGAYRTKLPAPNHGVVAKVASSGARVEWATYLGGEAVGGEEPAYATGTPSIRVAKDGTVVVASHSASASMPTTDGAFDRTKDGESDMHVAKFSADGSALLFATYLGGSSIEYGDTHNLAVESDGSVIIAAQTQSPDFPTTDGAFQRRHAGNGGGFNQQGDAFVARLSADGARLLASTLLGGSSGEGIEGVAIGRDGRILVSGGSYSKDLPVTVAASRPRKLGRRRPEAYAAIFSPDLSRLLFGRYFGGGDWDLGLALAVAPDGAFSIGGETKSRDFPTRAAADAELSGKKNGVVVRFAPVR